MDENGGVSLVLPKGHQHFYPFEDQIKSEIKTLSGKERGVLSLQVQKTCEAHERGKRGPLLYSGNVKGYIFPGFLYLLSEEAQNCWKKFDGSPSFLESFESTGRGGHDFNGLFFFKGVPRGERVPPKEGFKAVKFEKNHCLWSKSYEKMKGNDIVLVCYAKDVILKNS